MKYHILSWFVLASSWTVVSAVHAGGALQAPGDIINLPIYGAPAAPEGFAYSIGSLTWDVEQLDWSGGISESNFVAAARTGVLAGQTVIASATDSPSVINYEGSGGNPGFFVGGESHFPLAGNIDTHSVRGNAFILIPQTVTYDVHSQSDDAHFFEIETSGGVLNFTETGCCSNRTNADFVTLTPGVYRVEAIMQEGGGGDHFDLGFSLGGDGGSAAGAFLLGDTLNGSPLLFQLQLVEVPLTPEPGTFALFVLPVIGFAVWHWRRRK